AAASRCPTACRRSTTSRGYAGFPGSARRSSRSGRSKVRRSSRQRPSSSSRGCTCTRSSTKTVTEAGSRTAAEMLTHRYTRWDGSQRLRLDADQIFAKLGEYLSYTDDLRQALDWLLRHGLDLDDSVRVVWLVVAFEYPQV